MDRLYLNNPYIKTFNADIIEFINSDGKLLVVLNNTAFYPDGGGQPSDMGMIGECNVSYVYEENNIIYHVVDRCPMSYKNVSCIIDWNRRFDNMQQHAGQHILSAAFEKLLNGSTVGFHLGVQYVTVDISIDSLSDTDAKRVEQMANDIVFHNLPIRYHYPDCEGLAKFNLRKEPTVEENIRIVEIDGFDFSPCCGTHPSFTGEIGLIKIRKWEKSKDNIRVEFVCGVRALCDYSWKSDYINEISSLLSIKDIQVLETAKKTISELRGANKEIKLLTDKVLTYEASDLYNNSTALKGVRIIKQLFTGRDFKEIISLANKLAKYPSSIALLGLKSENAQMIFTRSTDVNIKINELFKEVLPLINGKGGGNPQSAQGGGPDISNLESALESGYIILKNRHLK